MQTDYMFAVQEICINLIYIPPTIKEENHVYTWLKMIAGFFNPNQQWSVIVTSLAVWTMFNIWKLPWDSDFFFLFFYA